MSKQKQAQLRKSVQPFAKPDTYASIKQLFNTILPLVILWFLACKSLAVSIWLTIPLLILASGFVIRIFIIFHDCTYGYFFRNSKAKRIIGILTGINTLFALAY